MSYMNGRDEQAARPAQNCPLFRLQLFLNVPLSFSLGDD